MTWLLLTAVRAASLFLLALAPWALSPDPAPPAPSALAGRAGVALLGLAAASLLGLAVAWRAPLSIARRAGRALVASVVAAFVAAAASSAVGLPLGVGVVVVAPPLWGALALASSALVARSVELAGAWARGLLVVVVAFLASYGAAARSLSSPSAMRSAALAREPANGAAVAAACADLVARKKLAEARALADACAAADAGGCGCRDTRAQVALAQKDGATALADATLARARCGDSQVTRRVLLEAQGGWGDAARAEAEASAALARGEADPRVRYARALALQRLGRLDAAREEAARAAASGAGRDARLLVAVLDLLTGNLDAAKGALAALAAEQPDDADVLYDLALVADRRGDYNGAREGYLRCLRVDPRRVEPRYNLVALTFRAGAREEARHHLAKLREVAPNDPRVAQLASTVEGR